MATLLLAAAGAAVGGLFGGLGATLGQAAGALAGRLVDETLLRRTSPVTRGPRLADRSVQGASEGAPIARVYGRARLTGEIIWATEHEEEVTESGGGKGGPSQRGYRYFANVAIGLCEGPIARVGRVWADGEEIDQTGIVMRVYPGSEDQAPDALILAVQGGAAPAYRGLAYVVFEHLPLEPYGNRLPQFAFEVIRVVEPLEGLIRGVCLIPGATEHGYETSTVTRRPRPGRTEPENRHTLAALADVVSALDELQALCPALESISLVVAWFGDDLRAGECRLRPKVESATKVTRGATWHVAGLDRADAAVVSAVGGTPSYGGTPSDAAVVALIREIRSRGLRVVLNPFILMDIPSSNTLPSPDGAGEQPAFPWRGRITCDPAPGLSGSPDGSADVEAEITAFVGTAAPEDFAILGEAIAYSGPTEWSLRRMVLHYAYLAEAAGGVDAILLGSELVGLTTLRSGPSTYTFVAALAALAADVRAVVGPATAVTYAADWSEWSGHRPADGSGDVHFHLDPLWASPDIDAVAIDWYAPLADWRDGGHADEAIAGRIDEPAYLRGNIAGGEDFDWYYADEADRAAQVRTPIVDSGYGKAWVFRAKDIRSWWQNPHVDRPGGAEAATPTVWLPEMKPIWLMELGCPAVDRGANEPNAFPDARSSEGRRPRFSNGARDDLMQRRAIEAHLAHWDPTAPGHDPADNPEGGATGSLMVDPGAIHLWAWDARPFPAFPARADVWADGANWETGHWLNGRLGGASLEGLVRAVLADHGVTDAEIGPIAGHVDGFVIDRPMSAREALEPLAAAFLFDCHDAGTHLRFADRARAPVAALGATDLLAGERGAPDLSVTRGDPRDVPAEIRVAFQDALGDYRRVAVGARREEESSPRAAEAEVPVAAPIGVMAGLAEIWAEDVRAARASVAFALAPRWLALEPGDVVTVAASPPLTVTVERIDDGAGRRVAARSVDPAIYRLAPAGGGPPRGSTGPLAVPEPIAQVLDLPVIDESVPAHRPLIAVAADPWPGSFTLLASASGETFRSVGVVERRAIMGELVAPLGPGPLGRFDRGNAIEVALVAGSLSGAAMLDVLAGVNRAAIATADGGREVVDFAEAELIGPDTWRLTGLLRGLFGTEDAMAAGSPVGAAFVRLDGAPLAVPTERSDIGRAITLRLASRSAFAAGIGAVDVVAIPGGRGLKPLSPAHLRARRDAGSGDVAFTWVRRARLGADSWGPGDVPLGEAAEAYRLEILDGTTVKRVLETVAPTALYGAASQTADFGAPPSSLSVRLAQVSPDAGPGITVEAVLDV